MTFVQKTREILYIGTYTEQGEGIYVYEFDRTNMLFNELQIVPNKNSPSFLEFQPDGKTLYSANEGNGTVSAYKIDQESGRITVMNSAPSQGSGPCHVSVDPRERYMYVSNYGSGSLTVYMLNRDGSIDAQADAIQHKGLDCQEPHMHSIVPSADGRLIYASDLGIDKILVYEVHETTGKLTPGAVPYTQVAHGDGPRHFVIDKQARFAYSVCELSSHVIVFQIVKASGALVPVERVNMLPAGFIEKNYAADIHLSLDGRFLYASNRGHDSIVIYAVDPLTGKLTVIDYADTHGKHPRNFNIDDRGELVFVANRDSNNIVVFHRDQKNGNLKHSGKELSIPTPVFARLWSL